MFQAVAAKADGEPCCEWVGAGGAGHYVKMVHNGIEYGDMQLICESYQLMKDALKLSADEMSKIFDAWNRGNLNSFLIEITRDILAFKDPTDGTPMVDKIRDTAGQKGTGKWTSVSALDLGIPVTMIAEAVFARGLSALKNERLEASKSLSGPNSTFTGNIQEMTEHLSKGLYCAKLVSYAQGLMLLAEAAKEYKWSLNFADIAKMWKGGCIIRSGFLGEIRKAYTKNPTLPNLLLDPFFVQAIRESQSSWRRVVAEAVMLGIPMPAFSSALAFYDGYRSGRLPANLLQAQRDYFGAHTFELEACPGTFHHVNWTGTGGNVTSTSYKA
jgi:6-phosphogluconate dehydrogenase